MSDVYNFVTTNSNGCDSTATLNLTINPSTTSISNVTECDVYSWNGQTYTSSGVYSFATTNANGCDSTAILNLTINSFTSAPLASNQTACFGTAIPDFVNTSINGIPYLWDFGDSNYSVIQSPSHIYDNPGVYDVMLIVKDVNECIDSITKHIVMYYDFVLHVPTSFSPNDDGDNDQFGPQGLRMNEYKSYSFYIYNRWGEMIFETEDINEWWDGADRQNGSYSWAIVIVDELGAFRKKVGNVLLIK